MLPDLMFYVFSAVMIMAALGVVFTRNPIFSVLFLILAFFNCAGLFLLLGAEFLGLLLVLVYVGAVAVMFLFVLMTIDIDFRRLQKGMANYLPVGVLVAAVLVVEILLATQSGLFAGPGAPVHVPVPENTQNIVAIGQVLFTDYVAPFQLAGLILLVAMLGAIILTHRQRKGVRRQVISDQVGRTPQDAMEVKKVKPGQGLV